MATGEDMGKLTHDGPDTPGAAPRASTVLQVLQRTLRGFTRRRFLLFCALVAIAAAGAGLMTWLRPGGTALRALRGFGFQYANLFVFFGTVWMCVVAFGNWAPRNTMPRVAVLATGVLAGLALGNVVLPFATDWLHTMEKDPVSLQKEISAIVLWSHVIAAGVLGYFFFTREEEAVARLHDEDLRRESLERELAEARLSVMQAQVEPHFLFNTLANVRRLYVTDPDAASSMLQHLSRYLGAMLPRMRSSDSTLGQELALATAYLSVQQIRMGPRLAVRVDVPEAFEALPFPPMMLVTLVENAIRHGLTPLTQGGEVHIHARQGDGKLRVAVTDDGVGLAESSGAGVGLANIRARLSTLHGGSARLLLAQNPSGGVTATIELPMDRFPRAARAA